jgi:hypothetical protein
MISTHRAILPPAAGNTLIFGDVIIDGEDGQTVNGTCITGAFSFLVGGGRMSTCEGGRGAKWGMEF